MKMSEPTPWPNQEEVVDGIVPVEEVPQDPDLLDEEDDAEDDEMED
jgi:hypothetical protein